MAQWFWYFLIYSFLGYGLEKLFAYTTRAPKQVRKCFLLLPLCPVYGLAMCAVVALVGGERSLLLQIVAGGGLCTGAEYLVHLFYDRVFGVRFWDYSRMKGNIRGRVCPQFALAWGVLSALALRRVQPVVAALASMVPPEVTFMFWMLLVCDCVLTAALLHTYRDTEILTISWVAAQIRASSQSRTSR